MAGQKAPALPETLQHPAAHHAKRQAKLQTGIFDRPLVHGAFELRDTLAQRGVRKPEQPAYLGTRRSVQRQQRCHTQGGRER